MVCGRSIARVEAAGGHGIRIAKVLTLDIVSNVQPHPDRAPRYPIHVPLRYRRVGGTDWLHGITENISASGVLFRGVSLLEPDTPVELDLRLSMSLRTGVASDVLCQGCVVRIVKPAGEGELPALAATIADYRFPPGGM